MLRVSSRQQLHDGDIPVQRAEAQRYIAQRPDWVFDREYIEKAVSAYKNGVEERAALQEILSDAREGRFEVLLTYMSDRIGRQEEYSFYVTALNRLGVEVWTIRDGQLKTEDHVDKLLNYIRFWQNEGESRKTGMRVRDTQRELVRAGKFVGGRAPYGYRLAFSGEISNHGRLLKRLEIVEEKARVVREIYSLAVFRGMGYERIARELDRQGIVPVTAEKWRSGTVRGILMNPVYMGYLALNRRVNRGGCVSLDRREWIYSDEQIPELVIVPRELWEKAQEIREARKARMNSSKKAGPFTAGEEQCGVRSSEESIPFSTRGRLLLTGLAYCGYCGKRLKDGSYYSRRSREPGERKMAYTGRYICPSKCPERSCYAMNYLEPVVLEAAEKCLGEMEFEEIRQELDQEQCREKNRMERELKEIRKKQRALRLDIQTLEGKIPEAIRGEWCFGPEKLSLVLEEKTRRLKELEEKGLALSERLSAGQRFWPRKGDSGSNSFPVVCGVSTDISESMEEEHIPAGKPDWKEVFRNADRERKKMLLASFVEKVEARNGEIRIRFRIRQGNSEGEGI